MPRCVDEQNLSSAVLETVFAKDDEASGNARTVEDVERQRDDGVHHVGLEERLANEVFVVGLAPPWLPRSPLANVVDLRLTLWLTTEQDPLGTYDPGTPTGVQ